MLLKSLAKSARLKKNQNSRLGKKSLRATSTQARRRQKIAGKKSGSVFLGHHKTKGRGDMSSRASITARPGVVKSRQCEPPKILTYSLWMCLNIFDEHLGELRRVGTRWRAGSPVWRREILRKGCQPK